MAIHPWRRRRRRFPVSVGGTSREPVSVVTVFVRGGHQSEEGPSLLQVYYSALYTVWENTASKRGFDQGGAGRWGVRMSYTEDGRRAPTPANRTNYFRDKRMSSFGFLHILHHLWPEVTRQHFTAPLIWGEQPGHRSSPKALKSRTFGEQGNNKPSSAQWKWQHAPPPHLLPPATTNTPLPAIKPLPG